MYEELLAATTETVRSSSTVFFLLSIIVSLAFKVVLGYIPARIAEKKGYSFGLFLFFGFFLFLPAFIVSLCIRDKNAEFYQPTAPISAADELKKYSELHDQGTITDEEFARIKEKFLN